MQKFESLFHNKSTKSKLKYQGFHHHQMAQIRKNNKSSPQKNTQTLSKTKELKKEFYQKLRQLRNKNRSQSVLTNPYQFNTLKKKKNAKKLQVNIEKRGVFLKKYKRLQKFETKRLISSNKHKTIVSQNQYQLKNYYQEIKYNKGRSKSKQNSNCKSNKRRSKSKQNLSQILISSQKSIMPSLAKSYSQRKFVQGLKSQKQFQNQKIIIQQNKKFKIDLTRSKAKDVVQRLKRIKAKIIQKKRKTLPKNQKNLNKLLNQAKIEERNATPYMFKKPWLSKQLKNLKSLKQQINQHKETKNDLTNEEINQNMDIQCYYFVNNSKTKRDQSSPIKLKNTKNKEYHLFHKVNTSKRNVSLNIKQWKEFDNLSYSDNFLPQEFQKTKQNTMKSYIILDKIAQGAFAIVKYCRQKKTGEEFAVKIYDKYRMIGSSHRRNLRREIRILLKLQHKSIIKLIQIIETSRQIFLVQEYIGSQSLKQYMKKFKNKRISEQRAKKIFKLLLEAIKYCHENHVVHRDIKLENILIKNEKLLKIIDFGISLQTKKNKQLKVICGTIHYMAPELVQRQLYMGGKVDLWALAVVLYQMLCGKFPYKGLCKQEIIINILQGKPKYPSYLSVQAKKLLKAMFQQLPADRPSISVILKSDWFTTKT